MRTASPTAVRRQDRSMPLCASTRTANRVTRLIPLPPRARFKLLILRIFQFYLSFSPRIHLRTKDKGTFSSFVLSDNLLFVNTFYNPIIELDS